jgi:molybdopterin/thiamine biosynthesis adenylyltransferase
MGERSVIEWLADTGWADTSEDAALLLEKTDIPVGLKPLLVVLCHGDELYGYQISVPPVPRITAPQVSPLVITRIDAKWALTRGHATTTFDARQLKRVLVLGAGSLGSPIIDILARAGVGRIDIVDSQLFEPANVSRHFLGMSSVRQSKAAAIAARLTKAVPAIAVCGHRAEAQKWMTENCTPGKFDLVLDLTAESSVRIFLSMTRAKLFEEAVVIHAWVEPFCSAAHVVASTPSTPWPATDPALECVNAADFTAASVKVRLPACSDGFHPYGSADIVQAAGFAAERIIDILDLGLAESTVWSYIRARAFFDALGVPVKTKSIVPSLGGVRDGVMITRPLRELVADV